MKNITELFHLSEWIGLWTAIALLVMSVFMWLAHSWLLPFYLIGAGIMLTSVGLSMRRRAPPIIGEQPEAK